jgi:hypothetical protein
MFRFSNRWFSLRMDLLGTLTIATVAAVTVASRGVVSPAAAGLALANVFQVETNKCFFFWLSRFWAEVRNKESLIRLYSVR